MNKHLTSNLLHVQNLYKFYGDKRVLGNVDLSVKTGEFCTVVGPSGCGKSTLLRIILGQELATSGEVLIEGNSIDTPDPSRGIVYQRYGLYPHMTVLDNVLIGLNLSKGWKTVLRSDPNDIGLAMSYLEKVRLGQHAYKYPHELSGGMQQRVAIAQSLIKHPKILMMDEPFGALDPTTREDLQLFLIELWEELGMTIFFVTHDLKEALFLGTRIFVLSQFYTDDRGEGIQRGSKIVADHELTQHAGTDTKKSNVFEQLEHSIMMEGFDPTYLQHARDFNLHHPDSFQQLTNEETNT